MPYTVFLHHTPVLRARPVEQLSLLEAGKHICKRTVHLYALVEVEVPEVQGRVFGQRHLVVVEKHPFAIFADVADVVPARGRRAHVAGKPQQLVLAFAVAWAGGLCRSPWANSGEFRNTIHTALLDQGNHPSNTFFHVLFTT